MKVAIIKYNAGNIRSVSFALQRIGVSAIETDDREELLSADRIIFPGVGEAGSAMIYLKEKGLDEVICSLKQPVLGICLGMQLLCEFSEESNTECLGIFKHKIKRFNLKDKVPQVGWNRISGMKTKLFNHVKEDDFMYFVHSYYAELCQDTIATANYGFQYSAALRRDNFYAVQFHPEKSAAAGQKILENFIALS